MRTSASKALACVMGDMDLVRPLGIAGIRCVAVGPPGSPARYSRFTRACLDLPDLAEGPEEALEALVHFGTAQPEPPVLFYEDDAQVLLIARHRERLGQAFRFVVAEPALVEDLVDKTRFQELAERLNLPVPPARRLDPAADPAGVDLDLRFPLIIKPLRRRKPWGSIFAGKAVQVNTPADLRALWPRLAALGMELLAQELIAGAETCIESYHTYVDASGETAGQFTGRKIRTYPLAYGHSTALVITGARDVAVLGRDLVRRLGLRGVAKLDFKRAPDGQLYLLEVNPRFNLWHHVGALAGVNLPALVYADLVGLPRPAVAPVRAGIRWCRIWEDLPAARAAGLPLAKWLAWALSCEAKSALAWDDPIPLLGGGLHRCFARLASARAGRASSPAEAGAA